MKEACKSRMSCMPRNSWGKQANGSFVQIRGMQIYRLSFTITLLLSVLPLLAQSPHGDELKMDCVRCHNPAGWSINYQTIQFDHSTTDFQLGGSHAQTDCKLCHSTMVFDQAPMDCASCHADIHSQSVGNDCVRCHTSKTWLVDNIPELHEANGFPLIGVHSNLSCIECHNTDSSNLRIDPLGNECIDCHQDDYAATQNPNHQQAGFSTDCVICHNPLGFGWDSESINHDFFPLTQGHDIQDCTQCHTTTNYADASPDCVSCHQDDYAATQNPNHSNAGYSTDCVSCHTTSPGWTPAVINHDFFPLTLGHDIQDCAQCHTTPTYSDVSPDCVACHQTDYDQTTNPNHLAANFPTDCIACHTTNPGWTPAEFDHDQYFPIYTGKHRQGEAWNDCVECHANPANYADFTCFTCHLKPEMDDKHKDENGYEYVSATCLECHPDGND